jgi:diadenosine tetraphosphatase ApaH/serine/threonine PP2A family protein phosphatase
MRYAIFTDIHANLEALEAVLAKIDELSKEEKIDQIWFLGDLVGYGPNPNECIDTLRERTDVIIAGNHDWAAVGKLDLEDFSAAARISAEWTAEQLTEEHREFLRNLPERLEKEHCTLVHGSPYGPLWEYLTSEVLAERSFQYFNTRFCVVGHTHVPVIFQQPDALVREPTLHLNHSDPALQANLDESRELETDEETAEMAAIVLTTQAEMSIDSALSEADTDTLPEIEETDTAIAAEEDSLSALENEPDETSDTAALSEEEEEEEDKDDGHSVVSYEISQKTSSEDDIHHAEERLNDEIEELLELLGLSQSMVQVTNEMIGPPEGRWEPPAHYRAIINPGGVGQPRDGDPRAAFMIFDSNSVTFDFYRISYDFEKTQEKIMEAGLPQYLAVRLAYGR